jgi:hypothetical protein
MGWTNKDSGVDWLKGNDYRADGMMAKVSLLLLFDEFLKISIENIKKLLFISSRKN